MELSFCKFISSSKPSIVPSSPHLLYLLQVVIPKLQKDQTQMPPVAACNINNGWHVPGTSHLPAHIILTRTPWSSHCCCFSYQWGNLDTWQVTLEDICFKEREPVLWGRYYDSWASTLGSGLQENADKWSWLTELQEGVVGTVANWGAHTKKGTRLGVRGQYVTWLRLMVA